MRICCTMKGTRSQRLSFDHRQSNPALPLRFLERLFPLPVARPTRHPVVVRLRSVKGQQHLCLHPLRHHLYLPMRHLPLFSRLTLLLLLPLLQSLYTAIKQATAPISIGAVAVAAAEAEAEAEEAAMLFQSRTLQTLPTNQRSPSACYHEDQQHQLPSYTCVLSHMASQ